MSWGLGDLVDAVSDAASDIGSGIADAAEAVADTAVDVAGNAGGYLGDTVGAVGDVVDTATFGGASALLGAVDDTVFDGVDYVTGGAVNIDFDDGRFSASVGIDGVADVGASIGEDGLTVSTDSLIASTDIGLTDAGLSVDTTAGINFGPLPYTETHTKVTPDGEVSVNGLVQGTVPTPFGLLSGHASGGFVQTDQGWGTYVDADGTLTLPSGTSIAGGIQAGYMEQGDDSQTTFGIHGGVTEPGVGTVGGSFGYQSTTHDGVTLTTEHGEVHASGFGASASASETYLGLDTPDGSVSQTTTDVSLSGPSVDALEHLGDSLLGDDAITGAPATAAAGAEGAMGAAAPAAQSFDDDVLGMNAPQSGAASEPAPMFASDVAFASDDAGNASDGSFGGDDAWSAAPPDAPVDAGTPDPVDDFTQSVGSADQIEQDTNAMFDDLG